MFLITADQAKAMPYDARKALAAMCTSIFPEFLVLRGDEAIQSMEETTSNKAVQPIDVPLKVVPVLLDNVDPRSEAFVRCLAQADGSAHTDPLQKATGSSYLGGIRSDWTRRVRHLVKTGMLKGDAATAVLFVQERGTYKLSPVTTEALRAHFGF